MGRIVASVELENTTDLDNASGGLRDESTIRRGPRPESPDSPLLKLK